MKETDRKRLIWTSIVCLLPMIMSAAVYNRLPEQVAIQWSSDGVPTNIVHKAYAAFGLPLLILAVNIVSQIYTYNDPKRANINQKAMSTARWVLPLISLIITSVTLLNALGMELPIFLIASLIIGVTFVMLGNYLPKVGQNYTLGYKLPWTLDDPENWRKTNRLSGYLFVIGGLVFIISGIIDAVLGEVLSFVPITGILVLVIVFVPAFYSFALSRRPK